MCVNFWFCEKILYIIKEIWICLVFVIVWLGLRKKIKWVMVRRRLIEWDNVLGWWWDVNYICNDDLEIGCGGLVGEKECVGWEGCCRGVWWEICGYWWVWCVVGVFVYFVVLEWIFLFWLGGDDFWWKMEI